MMSEQLRAAVRNLLNESASERTEAAAVLRDLAVDLGGLVPVIAGVLVVSALLESEDEPYEQMLFTLGELSVHSSIPLTVLEPLRAIEASRSWEVEYIQDIFGNAEARDESEA